MANVASTLARDRSELDKSARIAGALYLLAVIIGPFSLIYVPSVLFVTGNAIATAGNIRTHEMLLRFGILGDVLTGVVFLFVVLALHRLLGEVDRRLSIAMVILGGVVPLPIFCINALNWVAALLLAHGVDFLALSQDQRSSFAMLFCRLHNQGNLINSLFWGLWLFPLGMLVIRSGFLPRLLGYWLLFNGFAYLVTCFTGLLVPQYLEAADHLAQPARLGELAIMLWPLIKGAKRKATT